MMTRPRHAVPTILSFLLCCAALTGCPNSYRGWCYLEDTDITTRCLVGSTEGGYFIIGENASPLDYHDAKRRTKVMTISSAGDLVSHQSFDYMTGRLGVQTDDGGMLLVGCVRPNGAMEPHVAKLDSAGTVLWEQQHSIANAHGFWPEAITRNAVGGCVVAGNNDWYSSLEIAILVFDAQGLMTAELYPDRDQLRMHVDKILIAANGDYLLSGVTRNGVGCVARLDLEGRLLWTKEYDERLVPGTFSPDRAPSHGPFFHAEFLAATTPDGGLVLACAPWQGTDYSVPKLIRTDAEGNILWTVENIAIAYVFQLTRTSWTIEDMLVNSQGQIVIAGTHVKTDFTLLPGFSWLSHGSGYIMQFNSSGKLNWRADLSTSSLDQEVRRIVQTSSGDYAVLSELGRDGVQLVRVRKNGRIM